ncbi:stage III sporulation protein AF [Bacillus coahuilensis]|uniref:stage III sporulation protein AF n=1 Tax=Bacillus coahuilensis TaxID=408580 RepID=UPI0001850FA9|nr:stage III sporulation protein AF [Bacillus coahuilensis]
MNYLIEWITNIIIFILLATVIEMLLPSNQMKKYTKMVIGLLLISIILTPLFKLLSQDFEQMLKEIPVYNEGMDEKVKIQ